MDDDRFIHYKIGIKALDKEHSIIIQNFNDCLEFLKEKKEINNVLEFINKLLLDHFNSEEKFMVLINYPYLDNHVSEHKKLALYFKKKINESNEYKFQNRFLVSVLEESFLKHIDEQDKQIETFYYSIK